MLGAGGGAGSACVAILAQRGYEASAVTSAACLGPKKVLSSNSGSSVAPSKSLLVADFSCRTVNDERGGSFVIRRWFSLFGGTFDLHHRENVYFLNHQGYVRCVVQGGKATKSPRLRFLHCSPPKSHSR